MMDMALKLKRGLSRQFSAGSMKKSGKYSFGRQSSLDPRQNNLRFTIGRQSSMDPIRRSPLEDDPSDELRVPENLDYTMQLLFMASKGDVSAVQDLLDEGIDVNNIDLDGRTALHIASCEGHLEVVKLLLSRKANIDARDRWGSSAAADAKYYGNTEVYEFLKSRGAKSPKTKKTPMAVANPGEVPEYELNPLDIQIRKRDGISKGSYQVARWNGTKVSVKILDKDSHSVPECVTAFNHELTSLEKVRHPNVVQFVGAVTQNVPMMIVLERHSNRGDLAGYLRKQGRLSPSKLLRFALEIARGMNYLHECKPEPIIHCELKPKNILLDSGGLVKVAGFGVIQLSTISSKKVKLLQPDAIDRSNLYMAPEIYKDEIFDRSVDVHSFGLILYEMMEGAPLFVSKSPDEAAKLICLDEMRPTFKSKSKSSPPELRELIEECWHPDCVVRPTFSEIIVRIDKIDVNCSKQEWWKDTFKLPWK